MPKRTTKGTDSSADEADGFINLPVTGKTRAGLHLLKDAMRVRGQAEVVEQLVAIGLALDKTLR